MKTFKPGNRSNDRRDSFRGGYGDRDSRRPSMHEAVCDECGKDCQVPFRPSSGKPIYCSDCFERKGGRDSNRSRDRNDSYKRSFGGRDSGRPSRGGVDNRTTGQLVEKIEALNKKLDKIIDLLSSTAERKTESVVVKPVKAKKVKPKAEKTTKKSK